MFGDFQLTYFAVGRIAPCLLALTIAAYMFYRRGRDRATRALGVYFLCLGIYNFGYVYAHALNHPAGGYGWHFASFIALAGVARLWFAYTFPAPMFGRERRPVLMLALILATAALVDYAVRAGMLAYVFGISAHAYGSTYSSLWIPLVSMACFSGSIVVSLRSAYGIARTQGRSGGLKRLWREHPEFRALLLLALITIAEIGLHGLHFVFQAGLISRVELARINNLALLGIFSAYVLVYSSATLGRTGFMHRLVGGALVFFLAFLNLAGIAMESRDMDVLIEEQRTQAALELERILGDSGLPDRARFLIGPDGSRVFDSELDAGALDKGRMRFISDGRFRFGVTGDRRYSVVDVQHEGESWKVGFPYREFRARLHDSAVLPASLLVLACVLVVLIFPLLFRAGLLRPLRLLLTELRRQERARPGETEDEIALLRRSFQKMTELLREARREIPDFSPHLEEVERIAEAETRYVTVGDRTLVYRSAAVRRVTEAVERVKDFSHPVLITGETGTGKELIARLIHNATDPEGADPFVPVNCAALPESLWESEIFGHRKGAFTDARNDRTGRILEAGQGSVFFDEIGEMPLGVQASMLRLLQERQFNPVGSDKVVQARCRFIFATNRDLEAMVADGTFRKDLLYRIQVFHIPLPPLRDRPEDIPHLARFLVERYAAEHGLPTPEIHPSALQALLRHPWPGNVREMENSLLRALSFEPGETLLPRHFPGLSAAAPTTTADAPAMASNDEPVPSATIAFDNEVRRFSRALIERALQRSGGNKTKAAGILGLKRTTLRNRMKDLGLWDGN